MRCRISCTHININDVIFQWECLIIVTLEHFIHMAIRFEVHIAFAHGEFLVEQCCYIIGLHDLDLNLWILKIVSIYHECTEGMHADARTPQKMYYSYIALRQ